MIKKLQEKLGVKVDGIAGEKTLAALHSLPIKYYQEIIGVKSDGIVGKQTRKAIEIYELKLFIGTQSKMYGFTDKQCAYVIATVEHETAGTFKPVREAYWLSEDWRKRNLRYYGTGGYYGKGYIQITWKENYEKFTKILSKHFDRKIDLVNNSDLALDPQYALIILLHGFKNGTFTGKKIADYINDSKTDYKNARRCINGLDKATHIARLARQYD